MSNEQTRGTLADTEPHPAVEIARRYMLTDNNLDLQRLLESFSSVALSGNRMAEVCAETLRRLLDKEKVSDRYFMGLAWMIWSVNQKEDKP